MKLKWIPYLCVLGFFAFENVSNAHNAIYSPSWSVESSTLKKQTKKSVTPTVQVFLDDRKNKSTNTVELLDRETVRKIELEHERLTRHHRTQANYSTATINDRKTLTEKISSFSLYVLRSILSYQLSEGLEKAETNSEEVRSLKGVHDAVGAVAKGNLNVLSAAQPERTIEENPFYFKLGTRTNLPKQEGGIWMESSILNGTFDFQVGKPWGIDPWSFEELSDEVPERYRLTLTRQLPVWDIGSGFSYGGSTATVKATLSKQLSEHLNCELASHYGLDPDKSDIPRSGEETIRFNYGMNF